MTATLEADHKLTLPADVIAQGHLTQGMEFTVVVSPAGAIILRPSRAREQSLVEHLGGLKGLDLSRNREQLSKPLDL